MFLSCKYILQNKIKGKKFRTQRNNYRNSNKDEEIAGEIRSRNNA